jgi:hypothetical protein
MGDGVEATLTRTIACSKCGKMRHVCVADKNDAACLSGMNFERKYGICRTCEQEWYESKETEQAARSIKSAMQI